MAYPEFLLILTGSQIKKYLKDVSMDPTTSTFSFTQVILVWTLLGLLLTWLITFIVLALRSFVAKKTEWEDTATLSGAFPSIATPAQEHAVETVLVSAHSPVEVPGDSHLYGS
jgi:hypothetical protein